MTAETVIRVSIIVACRNEITHIRRFLDSLLSQDMEDITWEAILADGMSDDGTREILDRCGAEHSQLRILSNPGRIVSTGLNAAIRAACGDIIIRMDAHSWYAPTYCRLCVETLERTGADYVGGPVLAQAEGALPRAVTAAFHSRFSTGGSSRFRESDYEGWVNTLPFGASHKNVLERIGLFDESLVRNQDDELNIRLLQSGGKIWQTPILRSWYSPRSTLSKLFHQYFQYGFWQVPVLRKHGNLSSWRKFVPVAFVFANAMAVVALVVAAVNRLSSFRSILFLWLILLAVYLFLDLAASVLAARRNGWDTLPYLPIIFCIYHLSFGLGFLVGFLRLALPESKAFSTSVDSAWTRLTR
jgi:succinoglycan biosynthesis protein ExoA